MRISMALTLLAAAIAYPVLGRTVSIGLLLGGLAGTLVFWVTARRLEKLANKSSIGLYSLPLGWRMAGFGVYIAVLLRGYTLDKEGFSGLIAVVAGLFIIRFAAILLGLTGLDLPKEEE